MNGEVHDCYGCPQNEDNGDHYHQYINAFGDTTSCWYVDGRAFRDPSEVMIYLEDVLQCTTEEAHSFIFRLKKMYN